MQCSLCPLDSSGAAADVSRTFVDIPPPATLQPDPTSREEISLALGVHKAIVKMFRGRSLCLNRVMASDAYMCVSRGMLSPLSAPRNVSLRYISCTT